MGEDKNIMVLAFTVDGHGSCKRPRTFRRRQDTRAVLDADATPGTLEDGKHRVFVEFARESSVVKR